MNGLTALRSILPMVMWGGWYSALGAGWWRTSVFFMLTLSKKNLAASSRQNVDRCRAFSVCLKRAASLAKRVIMDQLFHCLSVGLWLSTVEQAAIKMAAGVNSIIVVAIFGSLLHYHGK